MRNEQKKLITASDMYYSPEYKGVHTVTLMETYANQQNARLRQELEQMKNKMGELLARQNAKYFYRLAIGGRFHIMERLEPMFLLGVETEEEAQSQTFYLNQKQY